MYIKQRQSNKDLTHYLPMAISPESSADRNSIDFRAPPPSPITSGRRSSVTNEEVLTEFLEHSLHVPDLVLPDRVFPRQKSIQNPPKIDFQSLNSPENDSIAKILDSIGRIGCFQLVNHEIARELIESVSAAGAGIFRMPPEKKAAVSRSPEKPYGFEEFHGEDGETCEEFVWGRDPGLDLEMEGIWPFGYSNFSEKMKRLVLEIEKVAERVLSILRKELTKTKPICENGVIIEEQNPSGTVCYLYKHCCNILGDEWVNSMRYDVIRMLIRGSDFSHALCFHVCDGSSEFHVYSKKGWVSFCPENDAIIVTTGDQIQAWSGGQYKHVIGRPIFKDQVEECISMAFVCSSPPNSSNSFKTNKEKTISLAHQAIIAILLTLIYHFLVHVYKL